jgi:hypothetical protein
MRAGGKGDASWLCGKVCSSNGTSVRRVIVERCPRTMGRGLDTLVKGRMIGGDVVFMDDK